MALPCQPDSQGRSPVLVQRVLDGVSEARAVAADVLGDVRADQKAGNATQSLLSR